VVMMDHRKRLWQDTINNVTLESRRRHSLPRPNRMRNEKDDFYARFHFGLEARRKRSIARTESDVRTQFFYSCLCSAFRSLRSGNRPPL